jgi:hypothetical protein
MRPPHTPPPPLPHPRTAHPDPPCTPSFIFLRLSPSASHLVIPSSTNENAQRPSFLPPGHPSFPEMVSGASSVCLLLAALALSRVAAVVQEACEVRAVVALGLPAVPWGCRQGVSQPTPEGTLAAGCFCSLKNALRVHVAQATSALGASSTASDVIAAFSTDLTGKNVLVTGQLRGRAAYPGDVCSQAHNTFKATAATHPRWHKPHNPRTRRPCTPHPLPTPHPMPVPTPHPPPPAT